MFTLIAENSRGERLNLTESRNYDLLRVDGLTPPTAAISTAVVGTMDGEKGCLPTVTRSTKPPGQWYSRQKRRRNASLTR